MTDRPPDRVPTGAWRALLPFVAIAVVAGGIVVAMATSGEDGSQRSTEGEAAGAGEQLQAAAGDQVPTSAASFAGSGDSSAATTPTPTSATAGSAGDPTPTSAGPTAAAGPRIQVKFVDGSGIRLRNGRLVSLTGRDVTALSGVLARYPSTAIERLFTRSEEELDAVKAAVEASSGRIQPDLNLYYRLTLPAGADRNAAIADLKALAIVETAYADPEAAPPPAPNP